MFYFQDSQFSQSFTTHEAILTAATGDQNVVKYGAGVFAFATSGGISLVFEDEVFRDFLSNNYFTLIVGIDDITNTIAINKLEELKERHHPNLEVKVFSHQNSSSLFHPKFIWFKIGDEIRLIAGSGNLTEKGLRRNREAFTINNFTGDILNDFEEKWNLWINENTENLKDLDDEEVTEKAAENARRFMRSRQIETEPNGGEDVSTIHERSGDYTTVEEENEPIDISYGVPVGQSSEAGIAETEDYEAWVIEGNPSVLIAEIPKSGNRWEQANFNQAVFQEFFGGIPGVNEERRILLRHIGVMGALEEIEVRPTVSVKSQNFRIELKAAAGLPYPEGDDRPIGIFIKVATRSFIYSLVMPEDLNYNEVIIYLNRSLSRVRNRMRRYLTDVQEFRLNCPNANFWLI